MMMNKEKIIKSTFLKMLETKPFYQIKVSDLTREAGISRSSFYSYYDSIPDLLHSIEDEFIDQLPSEDAVVDSYVQCEHYGAPVISITLKTAQCWSKQLDAFRVLSSCNGDPEFQYRMQDKAKKILDRLYGASCPAIKKRLMLESLAGMQWSFYRWWANNPNAVTADELAEECAKSFAHFRMNF